jgi:pimeloyl-ACP methyl ester carboxylesterase
VPVSPVGIGSAHIYGELCVPAGGARADTVQLLVHGGTYDHNYFDWPQDQDRYSYVDKALRAGYATFTVDRLGVGESSRPLSALVTFENGAEAMHQVIGKLRGGEIGGRSFSRVVWVGHSMGSLTAWFEAQKYKDVSAFVLTGIMHFVKPTFSTRLINLVFPAMLDERFRGKILDPGYLTSLPGRRADTFYYEPGADRTVIEQDERSKQTLSVAEMAEITVADLPPPLTPTRAITVPTLLVMGDHDAAFCGPPDGHDCTPASIAAAEKPYYRPEAHLQVITAADSGHDVQLHLSARRTNADMIKWIGGLH